MSLRYKLIVSDFDGTLCSRNGKVSAGNAAAIGKYVASGGIFAICTGRMPSSIIPRAKALGLSGPVASYQGAYISDIESGKILRDCRIPCLAAIEICRFLQQRGEHIHVYDGDVFYVNRNDDFRRWYEASVGLRARLTPEEIDETVEHMSISPHKILVVCNAEERDPLLAAVQERFGKEFYVTTSMENLVEIISRDSDKGDALEFLARYYHVPIEETIGMGDNMNDLPLVRRAGLGIAVGNAEAGLKAEADALAPDCDADAVASVISVYGMEESLA